MCMIILLNMCACLVCVIACCHRGQKNLLEPLKPELQTIGNHRVDSGRKRKKKFSARPTGS